MPPNKAPPYFREKGNKAQQIDRILNEVNVHEYMTTSIPFQCVYGKSVVKKSLAYVIVAK